MDWKEQYTVYQNISNDIDDMRKVFNDIFSLQVDDALRYDLDSIEVISITEFKEYHGVNVSVVAYLDKTRIPISIDVGFGDVIYPNKVSMNFPALLDEEAPRIYAYSLASSIAEKFEAIVSLGYDNSRFKDYYDIYIWGNKHFFEGAELLGALKETFEHRNTSMDTIVAFEAALRMMQLESQGGRALLKRRRYHWMFRFKRQLISLKNS